MDQDQNQFQQYNQFPQDQFPKEKHRHGCVTAWLIMMIVMNSLVAMLYLFGSEFISRSLPQHISKSMFYLLGFIGLMNIVFAVMLLKFKRWGFYGFIGTAVASVMLNLKMDLGVGQSLAGLIGIGILYGILQIKQDGVSAWEQMD